MKFRTFKPKQFQTRTADRGESSVEKSVQEGPQPQNANHSNQPQQITSPAPKTNQKNLGNGLKLIPLGGVGLVQKNMYVYEYQDDIIIVDCGVGFPDEGMPGVDLIIPDISYLRDKKHKIKAIIITHAHEDHIGALPYILARVTSANLFSKTDLRIY
jgi:predicted metal-dependent RNase